MPQAYAVVPRQPVRHVRDWSDAIAIVCDGWAMSAVATSDGRRQIVSFLLSGDAVSATCAFEQVHGRSVEAITRVVYRQFPRALLKEAIVAKPSAFDRIAAAFADDRAESDQHLLDLGRRTAEERVCRLILTLAERQSRRGKKEGNTMEFPLKQRHIADSAGLTTVYVSKLFGQLQRAGLLSIAGGALTLRDEEGLRRLAGN